MTSPDPTPAQKPSEWIIRRSEELIQKGTLNALGGLLQAIIDYLDSQESKLHIAEDALQNSLE